MSLADARRNPAAIIVPPSVAGSTAPSAAPRRRMVGAVNNRTATRPPLLHPRGQPVTATAMSATPATPATPAPPAPLPPNAHVSQHPCLRAKLSQLRSRATSAREAKALIHEIALIVGCEALAHGLHTRPDGTVRRRIARAPAASAARQKGGVKGNEERGR